MALRRQHLIDPEVCIRCNTCEETCPIDAVTHNDDNYVVDAEICNFCMDCIAPCPTGAIDSWRTVSAPYGIEEQFEWDELPEEIEHDEEAQSDDIVSGEDEAVAILERAHEGQGRLVAPGSAAHPYVNLYTRSDPAVARVVGNYPLTKPGSEAEIHHIVLDFGSQAFPVLEGQSIGILPPGNDDKGRPHLMRLYSIASPRDGERPNHNNVALTIKRESRGIASNYVCTLKRGDEVKVAGPFGNTFLMPDHPEANLIMICTGTGAAPFRAMTERRRRTLPEASGKLLLFFGARSPAALPYHGPLMKLPESLIDVELAFSRLAEQPKQYVQDRMRFRDKDIADLLRDSNTHIYVCGLKGMEEGVEETLSEICQSNDLSWDSLRREMRENGRYHVETY